MNLLIRGKETDRGVNNFDIDSADDDIAFGGHNRRNGDTDFIDSLQRLRFKSLAPEIVFKNLRNQVINDDCIQGFKTKRVSEVMHHVACMHCKHIVLPD